MFKFNFGFEETSNQNPAAKPCLVINAQQQHTSTKTASEDEKEPVFMVAKAVDFMPGDRTADIKTVWKKEGFELRIIQLDAITNVSDPIVKEAVERTDVETGVYEGGFKLWECAMDLVEYLVKNPSLSNQSRVLELGCGHGLPGIASLILGAKHVSLQDLNLDVLTECTTRSLIANIGKNEINSAKSKVTLVSGDWRDKCLIPLLMGSGESGFDLILSSEGIYNPDFINPLLNVAKKVLGPTGRLLIASKTFYFGVGGSTERCREIATTLGFSVETVWTSSTSSGSAREILSLTRISDSVTE